MILHAFTDEQSNRRSQRLFGASEGFTRVDLAGAVAITVLLITVLSPALARTRVNDRALVCFNNLRQLVAAWRAYAEDNQDKLVPNLDAHNGGWADGWEDWNAGNRDNTNVLLLLNAKLGPYAQQASIYRCPADTYLCAEAGGQRLLRVRSVSMNGFVGSASASSLYYGWRTYFRFSEVQSPAPAGLWIMTEEHPDSINDAWFAVEVTNPTGWVDLPAGHHDGACNFGFADGHGELKKWTEKATLVPVRQILYNGSGGPVSKDVSWVAQRTSAPLW